MGECPRHFARRGRIAYSRPPRAANVMQPSAAVTGPDRFESVEDEHQAILRSAPEVLTPILLEHLAEHGGPTS